jgi:glycosyltransferase involved in cell wall biosynthesis
LKTASSLTVSTSTSARNSAPSAQAGGSVPPLRVLYSFPFRIGAERICTTAWHQVNGVAAAGAKVTVLSASFARPFTTTVRARGTLSLGRWRIPYRFIGKNRMCWLHDVRTARWLARHAREIDLVHAWPTAAQHTIRVAHRHGIPVLLERPNAHTRYAYTAVAEESRRLGLILPPGSEHAFDAEVLSREEAEYAAADFLLCPSDFVARTFRDEGYPAAKLLRHRYGYAEGEFYPPAQRAPESEGLVVLYAGICNPRKGLHHALTAWLASGAAERGTFLICGSFLPSYRERISSLLEHPSVHVMGQRRDLADIMRRSDVFVLPTVEEGSALVTYEARACGCVLAVSDASGAVCEHGVNALVHPMRDVEALTQHFTQLDRDRALLERFRTASLATTQDLTWTAAGEKLLATYREALARVSQPASPPSR